MSDLGDFIQMLIDDRANWASNSAAAASAGALAKTEVNSKFSAISTNQASISSLQANLSATQSALTTLSATVSGNQTSIEAAKLGKSVALRFDQEKL